MDLQLVGVASPTPRYARRMGSDLSEQQNKRLRAAMLAALERDFGGNKTSLAKAIGRAAPSISDFLNRKGGASYETAKLFAARVEKRHVLDVIGEPGAADEPVVAERPPTDLDVDAHEFFRQVMVRYTLPNVLRDHPRRWRLSTIVRALRADHPADAAGTPPEGWLAYLDATQSEIQEEIPQQAEHDPPRSRRRRPGEQSDTHFVAAQKMPPKRHRSG